MGVTVENQEQADKRIPLLLEITARVRWLSCEPLLEDILLDNRVSSWLTCDGTNKSGVEGEHSCCENYHILGEHFHGIDWVISGGESGNNARPMHPLWATRLRDQCTYAGVPFFHKQNGEWLDARSCSILNKLDIGKTYPSHKWPDKSTSFRIGKKEAGNLIDGKEEWLQFPE